MFSSKERVERALTHQTSDRVPIDYSATPEANQILKEYFGITSDEGLRQRLGVDCRQVAPEYIGPEDKSGVFNVTKVEEEAWEDIWGVKRKPVKNEFGAYNEIVYYPLGEVKDVKELDDYSWPDLDWFDCSKMSEKIDEFNDVEERWILMFGGGAFESPWYMRGMEKFLMDLVLNPELAEGIIKRVVDFYISLTKKALEASKGKIDMVLTGGDIGTQRGMMLSPELWRKHIRPWSDKLMKTYTECGVKSIYHSCGSIVPVIGDFIEMGLDVLDPIQPGADGMDPVYLKNTFGDNLTFHGGIDEQRILPFSTPEEVKEEILRYIRILGKNGGYILAPAHAIQGDTPPENIEAMYDTALECKQ